MRANIRDLSQRVDALVREHRDLSTVNLQAAIEVDRECEELRRKARQLESLESMDRELADERCRSAELEAQLEEARHALEEVRHALDLLVYGEEAA